MATRHATAKAGISNRISNKAVSGVFILGRMKQKHVICNPRCNCSIPRQSAVVDVRWPFWKPSTHSLSIAPRAQPIHSLFTSPSLSIAYSRAPAYP